MVQSFNRSVSYRSAISLYGIQNIFEKGNQASWRLPHEATGFIQNTPMQPPRTPESVPAVEIRDEQYYEFLRTGFNRPMSYGDQV